MSKVFGYPKFDERGEMVLTTYDGDYAAMLMDVRVYQMKAGETRSFCRPGEEIAVLLLRGGVSYTWETQRAEASRRNVFTEGPWCVQAQRGAAFPAASAARRTPPGNTPAWASLAAWPSGGSTPFSTTISARAPTWSWGRC